MTQVLRPPSAVPAEPVRAQQNPDETPRPHARGAPADLAQPDSGGSLVGSAGQAATPVARAEPRRLQRNGASGGDTAATASRPEEARSGTPETPQAPTPETFTDAQFEGVFLEVVSHLASLRGERPIAELFTPEERRAVASFIANRRLPLVGTFATFFSRVPDTARFVFSACLHVADRSRVVRGANGQDEAVAVRANDCGDWVGRVVTYARNEAYVSRAQRRRDHMVSPDGLYRHGHGNQLLAANEQGVRSHRAVDRAIIDQLAPGDWVMIHWRAGTRPGESNHSLMFLGCARPAVDRQGRRRARFAHQGDNRRGGGRIDEIPISSDPNVPPYVYNVRGDHEFTTGARGGAGGGSPQRGGPGEAGVSRRRVHREGPPSEAPVQVPAAVRAIAEANPEKAR